MTEQKTNTRKRTTRPKTQPAETSQVAEEVIVELKDTDKIPVLNNTTGRYAYHGENGYSFTLEEYGDIAYVPFEKIRYIMGSKKAHITKGFIMILDERVIEELNQTQLYNYMFTPEEVEELLDDVDKLIEKYPKMPEIMKETVVFLARQKAKRGEIEKMSLVRAIRTLAKVDITVNTVLEDMN